MDYNQAADQLTPEALRDLVLALSAKQSADDQSVTITTLVNALTGGAAIGRGREGWQAFLRLKRVIKEACSQVADMRYIESDS